MSTTRAKENVCFTPLAEVSPFAERDAKKCVERAQICGTVVTAVMDSGAVPVRELAGIVAEYALKRQLKHFMATVPGSQITALELPREFSVEDLEFAPGCLRPGDIIHTTDYVMFGCPSVHADVREYVLSNACSYMVTSTDAKNNQGVGLCSTIQGVSAELTKMGLTFDALGEIGMYRLDRQLANGKLNLMSFLHLSSTSVVVYRTPRGKTKIRVASELPANGGAVVGIVGEQSSNKMTFCRHPKKDTRI